MQGFFFEFWGLSSAGGYNAPLGNQGRKKPCCFPQSGLILGPLRFCGAIGERHPCKLDVLGFTRRAAFFPSKVWPAARVPKLLKVRRQQNCRTDSETAGGALQLSGEDFLGAWHQRARLAIFGAHFVALGFHTPWGSARSKFGGGSERCLGSLCLRLVELRIWSLPPAFQWSPSSSG